MNRILITGGAGFIGANFAHYWLSKYDKDHVVVLDSLTYAGNPQNLNSLNNNPRFRFVKGSINSQELVEYLLREENIDTLVHFAAESHVDRSISGPDAFLETNINGTHALLKAAKNVWLADPANPLPHRFHHVSTDEVYGTLAPNDPPFTETTPYAPNSPYSASKAASDHFVRAYYETYGLQVSTSNCSNNYGFYHFPEKLIPLCLTNILDNKALPIYGDGQQIRDWLYVEDHCRGIDLVIKQGKVGETYNIGGVNEWANIDIVNLLCELVDQRFAQNSALKQQFPLAPAANGRSSKSLITYVTDRAGHDRRYAVATDKINAELGYQPVETFATGIEKTIDWYLNNESWWRAVQDGSYQQWGK
ncbi:dTDP-glucose 4,6-dehydratase [Motilimonas sp. 1_MG-2023]|uniref:dTDP-glucose 4,6-dehydratase n=1 Tax=Motilimonas sp. 1_MG-2023 TaxID=3062672 RepID=UPI0026E3F4A4|nr:dTDP-glucose 4,6-dehydratase [Motilimonas sp. 1_MG-2023]MDO6527427.1 dTDP-glucose 4,6-dehydratase [Motilimonas sp. 1_MG-2023]